MRGRRKEASEREKEVGRDGGKAALNRGFCGFLRGRGGLSCVLLSRFQAFTSSRGRRRGMCGHLTVLKTVTFTSGRWLLCPGQTEVAHPSIPPRFHPVWIVHVNGAWQTFCDMILFFFFFSLAWLAQNWMQFRIELMIAQSPWERSWSMDNYLCWQIE